MPTPPNSSVGMRSSGSALRAIPLCGASVPCLPGQIPDRSDALPPAAGSATGTGQHLTLKINAV